jgi:hypothetical protein
MERLEWILWRLAWVVWSGFNWLRMGTVVGCCEYYDEASGSISMVLVRSTDIIMVENSLPYLSPHKFLL